MQATRPVGELPAWIPGLAQLVALGAAVVAPYLIVHDRLARLEENQASQLEGLRSVADRVAVHEGSSDQRMDKMEQSLVRMTDHHEILKDIQKRLQSIEVRLGRD